MIYIYVIYIWHIKSRKKLHYCGHDGHQRHPIDIPTSCHLKALDPQAGRFLPGMCQGMLTGAASYVFFFVSYVHKKTYEHMCMSICIYICMYIYIYTIHGWLWLLTFAINYDILRNEPIWIDLDRSGYVVNWLPHPCSVHVPSKEERNRNHWLLNNQ